MMRRSWREGQNKIRQDLQWEGVRDSERKGGRILEEREVSLQTFSLGRDRNIIQTLILVYI